jgi:diguanylate cyclase (GGDEF)-like protein
MPMMGYDLDYAKAAEWAHSFVDEIAKSEACNAYSMNALKNLVGDLYEHSQKDKLTGLDTRRHFEASYPRYAAGTNSLLLIDCDHFKHVNDTLGHEAGDGVLRTIAGIIQASLRSVDAACRWGGDEIAIVLPRTEMEGAVSAAERMRDATQFANVNGVTLSIGLTVISPGEDLNDAMNRADAAMYEAKRNGGNAVAVGELLFPDIKV